MKSLHRILFFIACSATALILSACQTTSATTQAAVPAPAPTDTPAPTCPGHDDMVPVEAGTFIMGSSREDIDFFAESCPSKEDDPQCGAWYFEDELPRREVTLDAFCIDKTEVTNSQFAKFAEATGYETTAEKRGTSITWNDADRDWNLDVSGADWQHPAGPDSTALDNHPVVQVSYFDAQAYCEWAGKRLPSVSEWEKAARGTDGRRWPWGDRMDASRLNTYYGIGSTTEVTRYPKGASVYGVMDMAGNVSEWTADDFLPYEGSGASATVFQGKVPVASSPQDRAYKVVDLVPVDAHYKVLRGGSWKSDPFSTTTYHRNFTWPHYASDFFGFRCASDIEKNAKE